jgi:FkbM family methyltransferase
LSDFKTIDGLQWPAQDRYAYETIKNELDSELPLLLDLCRDKRTVIQAGGNAGLWPIALSHHFVVVNTFEPELGNFQCLVSNTSHRENIIRHRAALGAQRGTVLMQNPSHRNSGTWLVTPGDDVDMWTIDELEVTDCDLIQLDIEGYELFALQGAEQTIAHSRPVICVEVNGTSAAHGISDVDLWVWLSQRGYERVRQINADEFWIPRERT